MPARVLPCASVKVYDPNAEGYLIETGFDILDIPARQLIRDEDTFGRNVKKWAYTPSMRYLGGTYQESIHGLPEIGVVAPKPRFVYKDTPLARYNTFGGSWVNTRSFRDRMLRLHQYSSTKNTVWRAESVYLLPADSNICFTMQRLDAKVDNDYVNYPPKMQVTIGDSWMVRSSDGDDAGIYQRKGGVWQQVKKIRVDAKNEEIVVWVVSRNGCVCFSFDEGEKWHIARDDVPLSTAFGQIVVEGVSCQAWFGFHQLVFDNCSYTTYEIPTLEPRVGTPNTDLSYSRQPIGTAINLTFVSSSPASVRYRVDFLVNPVIVSNVDFDMYLVPELYCTLVWWDPVRAPATGTFVDLVSIGVVDAIDITEDRQVEQRSGEISILWDVDTEFAGSYGMRLVEVELGYLMDDDEFELVDHGVFYIIEPAPSAKDFDATIKLGLVDAWFRAETTIVDIGWRAFDGMTTVGVRNYVMKKMGLDPAVRASWIATGAVLPNGLPVAPRWKPEPGTTAAEIFRALDVYENTETFVNSSGIYTNRIKNYTDLVSSFTFSGKAVDPIDAVSQINNFSRHDEVKTAQFVTGEDGRGGNFWATSIAYPLERNPAYPGFIGWRIWDITDGLSIGSIAQAILIAAALRNQVDDVPVNPEITIPGEPQIFRGMAYTLEELECAGVFDSNLFRVEAITHRWRPYRMETRTEIMGRKL